MTTHKTERTLDRKQARNWLDSTGQFNVRLPRNDEVLEILTPAYTQYDLVRAGTGFTLYTTSQIEG